MNKYNTQNICIDPMAFQHPQNVLLGNELKKDKGFNMMVEYIAKNSIERELRGFYLSSYFQATEKSVPRLFHMLGEACELFGVEKKPEIFLERTYDISSKTKGLDNPMILMSTSMLTSVSEQVLWGFVASSVSMLRTNYCVVRMVEECLPIAGMLVPELLLRPLSHLLTKWRASIQLTNDRAALVATGDFNVTVQGMLAGEMPREALERINFTDPDCAYMQQCMQYTHQAGKLAKTVRNLDIISETSIPYATRYLELYKFYTNNVAAGDIGFHDLADTCGFGDLTAQHMREERTSCSTRH